MCDRIAGELLVSFHQSDVAASILIDNILHNRIPQVEVIESLVERLVHNNLVLRDDIEVLFYRLRVPPGQEEYQINYLQYFYKVSTADLFLGKVMDFETHRDIMLDPNYSLQVVPHSITSINTNLPPSFGTINLTQTHDTYKRLIGWNSTYDMHSIENSSIAKRKVLILDTGVDSTIKNVVEQRNFVDSKMPSRAIDDNGHGTVVAKIIQDLCPMAEISIYKVADRKGRASEWDTLAALAAKSNADIVNLSLAFGLPNSSCATCGRESQTSRSAVFETILHHLQKRNKKPIIVAAAGNNKKDELSFPARFNNVLAIESIDVSGNLSEFTNRSTKDQAGKTHQGVFVLPGGQKGQNGEVTEYVAASSSGNKFYGTSFSTAYASGILAALWSEPLYFSEDSTQILDYLRMHADKNLPGFTSTVHGNGLMRLL